MKRILTLLVFAGSFAFLGCATTSSPEPPSATKEEDIRTLLRLTDAENLGMQMANGLIEPFKALAPEVPEEYWEELFSKANMGQMIDQIVPIYDRHLTHQEIRDLIVFYQTPSGKALVEKMPQIMQESFQVGQAWGAKLGQELYQQLVEDGHVESPDA